MIPHEYLISFIGASVLLALAPGPDNIFVLTQSALRGRSAGLIVTLGLCTGLVGHSTVVALGVAVILKTSVIAFSILKLTGAAYLVYLSWQAFRASAEKIQTDKYVEVKLMGLYLRGILMNITNPKVSIFFMAFLPQFADPANGSVSLQIMILGCLFIVVTIVIFGAIAVLAGTLGELINRSDNVQKILQRTAGTVFLLLALNLAMAEY